MNITSRSRYAMKIMIDMAQTRQTDLVKRHDIVARQGVPEKYLDQIMIRLRRAGLVRSVRGRLGGYVLGKSAQQISVWEIFCSVEDGIYPVLCLDDNHAGCDFKQTCAANQPWQKVFGAIRRPLEQLSLHDLVQGLTIPAAGALAVGIQECPPGRHVTIDRDAAKGGQYDAAH